MGFLNSISNVYKNRNNFKAWEKDNEDKEARRQELNKRNPKTQAELEKARKEGKVIVDVIDIMDTHSEDVAENVETLSAPIEEAIPAILTTASIPLVGKLLIEPAAKKYEEISSNFIKNNKDKIDEIKKAVEEYAKQNENFKIQPWEVDHAINKTSGFVARSKLKEVPKISPQIQELAEQQAKALKGPMAKIITAIAVPVVLGISSFVAATIFATKLQVQSSRVARWQSREQLKDEKYFVQYTDEQIAQAKANLEAKKSTEGKKGLFSKFKKDPNKPSIKKVIQDNKNYKEWKKTDKDDSKKVDGPISDAVLLDAKKDKEVIQRVTKQINNKAEDYSENMETAAQVIFATTPVLGFLVAKPVAWIIDKLGFGEKFGNSVLNKFAKTQDEASQTAIKNAFEKLKNTDGADKILKKKNGAAFRNAMFKSKSNKKFKNDLGEIFNELKKGITYIANTQGGRGKAIGAIGLIASTLAGLFIGLKLQKSSARAGRFIAKREIEKNPENFIGYSDEELNSVKNVKAKEKSTGQKFKEYITFIPRVIGEYGEYQKFKKTKGKENKELLEELIKLDCSKEQLIEAKNTQKKLFNTFEKVDDGSQEYSESVEAFTTIAKPAIQNLGLIGVIAAPALVVLAAFKKGKINAESIIGGTTSFLAKHTKFLKGKIANKYLDGISTELVSKVGKSTPEYYGTPIVEIFKELDLKKYVNEFKASNAKLSEISLGDILRKIAENPDDERKLIDKIEKMLQQFDNPTAKEIRLMLLEARETGKIPQEFIKRFDDLNIETLKTALGLKGSVKDFGKGKYSEFIAKISAENAPKWGDVLSETPSGKMLKNYLDKIGLSNISNEKAVEILKNSETILKNIPSDKLKKIINTALNEFIENPAKFTTLMQSPNGLKGILLTKDAKIAAGIAGGSWFAINFAVVFAIESYLAGLQKKAGRLGVMKGLEKLEDPLYYADTEGNTPIVNQAPVQNGTVETAGKPEQTKAATSTVQPINVQNQPKSKALEEYIKKVTSPTTA